MERAHSNTATTETDKDLAAMVRAGCFASEAEALREAVHTLLAVRPHLRVEAAIRRYLDEEITLGRAAELASMTRWRLQELLAQRGIRVTYEARPAKELDKGVERIRGRRR
jgi:predicted HTH domain antitoxin